MADFDESESSGGDQCIAPLLDMKQINKRYPGVLALDQVDFDLMPGEVHILFGENGAGKSTLISIVAGAIRPNEGEIRFRGEAINLVSVHHARELGISAVFQEFSLVSQMTVEENLFLGSESTRFGALSKRKLHEQARAILDRLGFDLDPNAPVQNLTRAEQQMVEIAKAFRSELSILILDEPTASLTERETEQLFDLIEQVKAEGVAIIYITHRMNEIQRIGDRITVLRDGRLVATVDAKTTNENELVQLMTGRVIEEMFPAIHHHPGEPVLEIEGLSTASGSVKDATIEVCKGEVVALAGLVGSGKSEIARAAFGLEKISAGRVALNGEDITGFSPRRAMDRGFFYLPPDRRQEGLVMMRSVRENVALPALDRRPFARGMLLDRGGEVDRVGEIAQQLNLQPPRIERAVDHFSGGNQQKVLLAKCLTRPVQLFAFDEPTVGVDVGTRVAIYEFIRDLCEAGAAVLLISSDLPEVLHLGHRVYVFYRGRIQNQLVGDEITEKAVLEDFFEREAA